MITPDEAARRASTTRYGEMLDAHLTNRQLAEGRDPRFVPPPAYWQGRLDPIAILARALRAERDDPAPWRK